MLKCDRCGKGVLVGMNVSHSHIRTKKRSNPNLHTFRVKIAGGSEKMRFCTKCLRIVKKQQVDALTQTEKKTALETPEKLEVRSTLAEEIEKAADKASEKKAVPQEA